MKKANWLIMMLFLIALLPSLASASLTDNVVLVWEMQNSSAPFDVTGHGYHANVTGNLTYNSGEQSFNISGTGSASAGGNNFYTNSLSTYINNQSSFTIELWIDFPSAFSSAAGYAEFGLTDISSSPSLLGFYIGSNSTLMQVNRNGVGLNDKLGLFGNTGTYKQYLVYYNSSDRKVYYFIDNVLNYTSSATTSPSNQAFNLIIGADRISGAFSDVSVKKYARVALWNNTLTSAERTTLYNGGNILRYNLWNQIPSITFQGQTPNNATLQYQPVQSNFTVNTSVSNVGGMISQSHYLYNSSFGLVQQNNGSGGNYTSNFSSLGVGIYYFNASFSNGSLSNFTETRTITFYDIFVGNFTNPNATGQIINRTTTIAWNASSILPNQSVNISNYVVQIYNSTGLVRTLNGSLALNTSFFIDFYPLNISKGTYYLLLLANDTRGVNENVSSVNFSLNIDPHITANGTFTFTNSFSNTSTSNATFYCINNMDSTVYLNATFNGINLYNGVITNNTLRSNIVNLTNGENTLIVRCYDYYESDTETVIQDLSILSIMLIDERSNSAFSVTNLSSVRVYFDDNSTYYDFKAAGNNTVVFSSNLTDKLRFEFVRATGDVITVYVDVSLASDPLRVCANREGVTEYEQAIISGSVRSVILKNIFSNCVVAADYTRFAYQNSFLLKAFTINSQYSLITADNGEQVVLASVDGSVQAYINIDVLEFNQETTNVNVGGDGLAFSKPYNNTVLIYYRNILADNNQTTIEIKRMDTHEVVYTDTLADPNELLLYFDYTTLANISNTTVFKITIDKITNGGIEKTIIQYFNLNGEGGRTSGAAAIIISLFLMFFGLTLVSSRTSLGWFGIVVSACAIAVLTFATPSWYVTFLMAVEMIILVYIGILLATQNYNSVVS